MTESFEEYLEDNEIEIMKCEECGNKAVYDADGYMLYEICARVDDLK